MARDFDNTNDSLLAADAFSALAASTSVTIAAWVYARGTAGDKLVALGPNSTTRGSAMATTGIVGSTYKVQFTQLVTSGNPGQWASTNAINSNQRYHLAVTYDGSSTSNDPIIYVDGTSVAITESITPTGAPVASDTIKYGEDLDNSGDLDGILAHGLVHSAVLTAEQINRARWWGRPNGGMLQYLPMLTSKVADEGSAAATFTASGVSMGSLATPCIRPGSVMLGLGLGW